MDKSTTATCLDHLAKALALLDSSSERADAVAAARLSLVAHRIADAHGARWREPVLA